MPILVGQYCSKIEIKSGFRRAAVSGNPKKEKS
jgi:hypothetical protein